EGVRPRSPGMKYRHYAPEAQVVIVRGEPDHIAGKICMLYDADVAAGKRTMILASQENSAFYGSRQIRVLGARADLGTMTAALFAGLRAADAEGMEQVYAEAVDTRGIGLALMNRLGRAAAFHWVDA
ncbi:MAG: Sua5 family C-terminal domain-containing protein, partial [Clostridia bacterium]